MLSEVGVGPSDPQHFGFVYELLLSNFTRFGFVYELLLSNFNVEFQQVKS